MLLTNKFESLTKNQTITFTIAVALTGSLLLALLARLSFPVPFSPIPITGQTFGILILGALLGRQLGTITVITYIFEGTVGLPVFAGGSTGLLYILGPTGGYIIGFIPAVFLVGYLSEKGWNKGFISTITSMTLGTIIIFTFGVSWLSISTGFLNSITIGLIPYLPGAFVKITSAAIIVYSLNRLPT